MIFCKDLLFIHVPKTGGLSTTQYLLDILPTPVYLSHPIRDDGVAARGIVQIMGKRHESLAEARAIVSDYGFAIDRLPVILATIRNPYDLEVSRYAYLRAGHRWEQGPEQRLALTSSFAEFAVMNEQRGGHWLTDDPDLGTGQPLAGDGRHRPGHASELKEFYTLDGRIPDNLCIIRFENLVGDLMAALRTIGIEGPADFPWLNRSPHDDYLSYYTADAEAAVYRRYRWVFDRGFYRRLDRDRLPRLVAEQPRGGRPRALPPLGVEDSGRPRSPDQLPVALGPAAAD